jgi:peptide/nickel transport system substrate-binding protein
MRTRSKRLTGLVAIAAVGLLAVSACSKSSSSSNTPQYSPGFAECETKPNTCNNGPTAPGGDITVAIEKTIPNWNTWDGEGNTYETGQVLSGLLPAPFILNPDGSVTLNSDMMASAEITSPSAPFTVVYKIKPEAVWSDGSPISAKDFEYQWHINNGKDCPDCEVAGTTGYDGITSLTGSDNDKTVTVVFKDVFADWQSLFGLYPSAVAAKQGDLTTPAGLKKSYDYFVNTVPDWSGGPYVISDYQKDVSITEKPNPKWYGKVKPSLNSVVFKIISDQTAEIPALQNNEVQVVLAQPSQDIVDQVKAISGVNYNLAKGPTWEHLDLNFQNKYFGNTPEGNALRKAIFTAIDREAIIKKTLAFFDGAAPLNNHNIQPGQPGYKDVITPTGQGAGKVDDAKKILTDAGYKIDGDTLKLPSGEAVPEIRFGYTNGNTVREQTGQIVQAQLAAIGVKIKLAPFPKLGAALASGDFDIIDFAWVGSPFLTGGTDLWGTDGGGNYGHYSNPDVDAIMKQIKSESNYDKIRDLFNQADEIMSKDAAVLPLYQKPVFLAVYDKYVNIRNNANLSGPTYNIQEWGLKATTS